MEVCCRNSVKKKKQFVKWAKIWVHRLFKSKIYRFCYRTYIEFEISDEPKSSIILFGYGKG